MTKAPKKTGKSKKSKKSVSKKSSIDNRVLRLERNNKPEEKEIVVSNLNVPVFVGQVAGNLPGYYSADITPIAGQGATTSGRIGSRIRLKSFLATLQFAGQGNYNTPINLKIMFIRTKGIPVGSTTVVNDIFKPNPFIYTSGGVNAGIVDYNSYYDYDYKRNFQILAIKHVKLPLDFYQAGTGVKTVKIHVNPKSPMTINFDNNTNNIASGQISMVILCDSGNYSATVASTCTGIPIGTVSSGMQFQYIITHYYIDE